MADDFELVRVMKGDGELASVFLEMGEDYMGSEPPELRGRFLKSGVDLQVEEERWLYLLRVEAGFIGFVHMKYAEINDNIYNFKEGCLSRARKFFLVPNPFVGGKPPFRARSAY